MILVFGATGDIGGELISILSSEGVRAVAVTRAPERQRLLRGIRWTKADLAEPASIEGLLGGVKTMFLLTGNGPDLAALQITAIRAAAKARVEYVVKLSALGASDHSKSPIGRAHYEAEQELIASGMRWVILRPHAFMQNLLDPIAGRYQWNSGISAISLPLERSSISEERPSGSMSYSLPSPGRSETWSGSWGSSYSTDCREVSD